MTNKQLKNLKDRLWESADQLRANSGLKPTEYVTPILGLIFLRFAQKSLFEHFLFYHPITSVQHNSSSASSAPPRLRESSFGFIILYVPVRLVYGKI